MTSTLQLRWTFIVFVGFWTLFLIVYWAGSSLQGIVETSVNLRSEYRIHEQLSKYYLFLIILMAIAAYVQSDLVSRLQTSLGFLILGLVLYLAESNMITEKTQLVFGPIIIASTLIFLFRDRLWLTRDRLWLTIVLFCAGFGVMFGGIVLDFVHENRAVAALVPGSLVALLPTEEVLDTVGQALVCLAAIFCFRDEVTAVFRRHRGAAVTLLLFSGLITIGNSFAHHQYRPGARLESLALLLSLVGFSGVVLINRRLLARDVRLQLPTEVGFYLFVWGFFVAMPVMFGGIHDLASLVLWPPVFLGLGWHLYTNHPLRPVLRHQKYWRPENEPAPTR